MNYPLISEYVDAIRSAEDNFDKLSRLRPVFDSGGNPVMSSGNFAVVFKMKDIDTGKLYAVKCFTKEQAGREEAYRQITDELEFVQSPYLAKVRYCDRELFVDTNSSDESEFPVLLMDWVDGTTLDRYVRQNLGDRYALEVLAHNFSRLAMWLLPQPFAHGDLKPDNILVRHDGSLTLVDYDGMFVPAMQGQKSRELGSPDFRHPLRTADDFTEHIDDFPAVSILLSLRLIASDPSLLDRYGAADRLLFSESDYRDLSSCQLLKAVFPSQDAEVNTLVGLFAIACGHKTMANVSFRLLAVAKPQKPETVEEEEELYTEVTDEDLKDAIEDEFGAKYSRDGKRLLKGVDVEEYKEYKIKEGTKVICDWAFMWCESLREISIPQGVASIGNSAFWGCESLQEIIIPRPVKKIGTNPFAGCKCKVICNSPNFRVVDGALYDADMTVLISFLSDSARFAIPDGVTSIGDRAFSSCYSLREISIPDSVTSIGDKAFSYCESLRKIIIPRSVKKIGINPFCGCKCKVICNSSNFRAVDGALYDADMTVLISFLSDAARFTIPQGVTSIGDNAFWDCKSLQEISIPSGVTSIGDKASSGCESLQEISIPSGVTSIGDEAFMRCKSLQEISIPSGVTSIGDEAFSGCKSLQEISIPDSVTSIGESAFMLCTSLEEISIPLSVTSIDNGAFMLCTSLQKIKIPKGSREHFEKLLPNYLKNKLVEV